MKNNSLLGKTIAVTGCTGGLGRELCFSLAALGARLVMLDRNPTKAEALKQELTSAYDSLEVIKIQTELEDINSVKSATEKLKEITPDIFIHNAGAYSIPRHICTGGYDNLFQINFISPYYIVRELKAQNKKIKIVAVGSIAHNYSHIDENDVDFKTRKSSALAYGNSKRFLMFSLHEYFKETGGHLAVVHPGITFTNITAHYPKLIFAVIKHPMKIIFMKPKKAVLSILEGVFKDTPYGFWTGPSLFNIWGKPKVTKLKTCSIEESRKISLIADGIYKNLIDK